MMILEHELKIDPFLGKDFGKSEIEESVLSPLDLAVENTFRQYQDADQSGLFKDISGHVSRIGLEVLNPGQINHLLQKILRDNPKEIIIRLLINKLLLQSYLNGFNDFLLNTQDMLLDGLVDVFKAEKTNPLQLTILGNVGNIFGMDSKYCIFNIAGNAGKHCGYKAKHCTFNIGGDANILLGLKSEYSDYHVNGNVGNACGDASKWSRFYIQGNAGYNQGTRSNKSVFTFHGEVLGLGKRSTNSDYRTTLPKAYDLLLSELPKNNTVALLDRSGNVIMEERK